MDYLKRPIEIEILGLKKSNKPTNSSLCGWQVYVLGIFFMGWGNKIWLAPKLEVLLPKTTAHPQLTHQLAITKSNGINWKKLLKIKTVVAADKINNYFCLEVNYSCGHQF